MSDKTMVFDTPDSIAFVQLVSRRGALRLELVGLKRSSRGRTAYSICKEVYGLRGNRQRVLEQMNALIEKAHEDHRLQVEKARARSLHRGDLKLVKPASEDAPGPTISKGPGS